MKQRATGFEIGPPRQGQGSLPLVQILRAVAALAVALDHLTFELARQFKWEAAPALFSVGGAGVDVFFVISGFVIVYVSEPLFGKPWAPTYFFARRLARIAPLYWWATAVVLLDDMMRHTDLAAANLSLPSAAASFYFFPYPRPDGRLSPVYSIGWTLNYEFFFYSLFAVAILAARRTAVLAVGALFAALVTLGCLVPLPAALVFWSNPIILEFVSGMLVAVAFRAGWRCPTWFSCALIVAGFAACLLTPQVEAMGLPRVVTWGLPAVCILAGLVCGKGAKEERHTANAFRLLGNASYALYLVHPFVFVFPRRFFPEVVASFSSPVLYGLLLLACSTAAAIAVHLTIEKPIIRMLHRGISRILGTVRSEPLVAGRDPTSAASAGTFDDGSPNGASASLQAAATPPFRARSGGASQAPAPRAEASVSPADQAWLVSPGSAGGSPKAIPSEPPSRC